MPFFDHYPYTNFHNVNLDWVLQAVKSWGALVEQNNQNFINLAAANEAFKEYVTGYITNLDVQDEINNKLDQMLESGALTQYFSPYIKTDVKEWLEENITPTTPAVDASLSIAGAAADAKATGDAITNLSDTLKPSLFSPGAKGALLSLLSKCAYKDSDAMDLYNQLSYFISHPDSNVYPIYQISDVTFTGVPSEMINTGLKPLSSDSSYTIACKFTTNGEVANNSFIFQCLDTGRMGIKYQIVSNVYSLVCNNASISTPLVGPGNTYTVSIIIRHNVGEPLNRISIYRDYKYNPTDVQRKDYTCGTDIPIIISNLYLGGGSFKGLIKDFKWFSGVMSDDEVTEYLEDNT